jgi:hypothetical protein
MPLRAPKHWIQGAIKHKGALTASAERHGKSTHEEAVKESHSSNPTQRKRGTLALTLSKMHKK